MLKRFFIFSQIVFHVCMKLKYHQGTGEEAGFLMKKLEGQKKGQIDYFGPWFICPETAH